VSSESASPTKKRLKLPGSSVAGDTDGDTPASLKGLKKSQVKKMEKEQQRLEKKAQKEQEKKAVAERKRLRGELGSSCFVLVCPVCSFRSPHPYKDLWVTDEERNAGINMPERNRMTDLTSANPKRPTLSISIASAE
jgi:SAGA-associated factor 73